ARTILSVSFSGCEKFVTNTGAPATAVTRVLVCVPKPAWRYSTRASQLVVKAYSAPPPRTQPERVNVDWTLPLAAPPTPGSLNEWLVDHSDQAAPPVA